MTKEEAAWLAGILEGEGCFDWNQESNKRWPRIRIEMKDGDIIHRIKNLVGGKAQVREIKRTNKNHSTTYCFQIAEKERVRKVLLAIRPWMGERRASKIEIMLNILDKQ